MIVWKLHNRNSPSWVFLSNKQPISKPFSKPNNVVITQTPAFGGECHYWIGALMGKRTSWTKQIRKQSYGASTLVGKVEVFQCYKNGKKQASTPSGRNTIKN